MLFKGTRRFLYAFGLVAVARIAACACTNSTCAPGFKSGYDASAQHNVYLDPSLTQDELDAANSAINGWGSAYGADGKTPPFCVVQNPGAAEIVVRNDPSLVNSGSGALYDLTTHEIDLNPDYGSRGDFLKQVLFHEFGHAIGFKDVDASSCNGQTIMYGTIDPNGYSFLPGLTDSDKCNLNERLNPFQPDPPDNPQPPREWAHGCGESCSPIVLNFSDGDYDLTGADDPVWFELAASGVSHIGWTSARADEAFLWLDRNHNGAVTSGADLFGNFTPLKNGSLASNGFEALKDLDDNHDGVIDSNDPIWFQLRLWRDLNHDGVSQSSEIAPVAGSSLTRIELTYHWTGRRDVWGNMFRYEAKAWIQKTNGHIAPHPVYDIFFVHVN